MTDPVREYGKFKTAERNLLKRYGDRIDRLIVEREQMLATLIDGLSSAAKRIRDAAEAVDVETSPEVADVDVETIGKALDLASELNEIPLSLRTPPAPLPPGALIEGRAKRA
jgi:hypothetical protein